MKWRAIFISLINLFLLVACVKNFDLEVDPEEDKVLVVDGSLHDTEGPYYVTLSYTYSFDLKEPETIIEAKVWIEDDQGRIYNYMNSGDTVFKSPNELRGEVGRSYILFVEVNDNLYKSDRQTLLASPKIDSIYGRYSEQPNSNGSEFIGGFQIFLDSELIQGDRKMYFRYEYNDAYLIDPPLAENPAMICHRTSKSKEILTETTLNSLSNQINEFPLKFLPKDRIHLRDEYGIQVSQFAISESAYLFYNNLEQSNDTGGSLFDFQVGSVFGNITNINNSREPVLGFFEVSGVEKSRAFFSYFKLNLPYPRPNYPILCESLEGEINRLCLDCTSFAVFGWPEWFDK